MTDQQTPFASNDEETLDLFRFWRSIAKRKWQIFFFALTAALVAAVIATALTPIYRSTVTLKIESVGSSFVTADDLVQGTLTPPNKEFYQTQVELLKSRSAYITAIKKLQLWDHPHYDPRLKKVNPLKAWINEQLVTIGFVSAEAEPVWNEETLAEAVYARLQKDVTVEPVRLSQLVKIHAESPDAKLAAQLANAIANAHIENDLQTRFEMTNQVISWLQTRLKELHDNLTRSEQALQAYREKHGIVTAEQVGKSGAGLQFASALDRLIEARTRRAEAESAYLQIERAGKNADLSSLPAVLKSPLVAEAKRAVAEAQRNLSEVSKRYGREHPKYIQAEAELNAAQENLRKHVSTVVASVIREYEAARATERALEEIVNQARNTAKEINRTEFELLRLEREVDANRQMYEIFLKRLKEINVGSDLQNPVARIVDPAVASKAPSKPKKTLIVVIATFVALLLGVAASLLLDTLDTSVKTSNDVENLLQLPVLTALPRIPRIQESALAHLYLQQPDSVFAESIRTARTGIMLSALDTSHKVLAITSSLPGEGKTSVAINLALAIAQTKKTLLVEADMRRPSLAKRMGLPPGSKGLADLVADSAPANECIQLAPGTQLPILPAGTIPPNPLELLMSLRFKEVLTKLEQAFDVILIDCPPLGLVSDPLVLAPQVTGYLYVIRAYSTSYKLVRKDILRLQRADANIVGVILNQIDFKKSEKYYGEHYSYSKYDYKSSYGSAYTRSHS